MSLPIEAATCPVCGSSGEHVFSQNDYFCGISGTFGQRRCPSCAMFFLSPRVPEDQIGRYYPKQYAPYHRADPSSLGTKLINWIGLPFHRRRLVERFVRSGRILDVGCGNGAFLDTLRGGAWETYAMDTQWNGDARVPGTFFEGRFDRESPPWSELDAITLWHVFEHLYHPQEALNRACALLKNGGYLFLAIPDLYCIERLIFGRYWTGWDVPRHVATYSAPAIKTMLQRAGLQFADALADVCSSELFLLNIDFYLASRGIRQRPSNSFLLRAMVAPMLSVLAAAGLASAKVYVARKVR